jgi:hypothetical protein
MMAEGRDRMLAELDSAVAFFGEADAKLTLFTRKIVESFGLLDKIPELMKEAKEATEFEFGQPLPGIPGT